MSDQFVLTSLDIEDGLDIAIGMLEDIKRRSTKLDEVRRLGVEIADLRAELAQAQAARIAHQARSRAYRVPSSEEIEKIQTTVGTLQTINTQTVTIDQATQITHDLVALWNRIHRS